MTKDTIKEDAVKLRNAVKAKDNERPIREGLKFLADNRKFINDTILEPRIPYAYLSEVLGSPVPCKPSYACYFVPGW